MAVIDLKPLLDSGYFYLKNIREIADEYLTDSISQIMDFLPLLEFRKCVKRYRGNHKVQKFSCLDQFLCMAFAQLTYRESLRDLEVCLRAIQINRMNLK